MPDITPNYIEEIMLPGGTTYKLRDNYLKNIHYGTCETAGNTATKRITSSTLTTPEPGDILIVTFSNVNTVTSNMSFRFIDGEDPPPPTYPVIPNEQLTLHINHPYIFYYDGSQFIFKDKLISQLPEDEDNNYKLILNSITATQKEITIPSTANAIFYNPNNKVISTDGLLKMTAHNTADSNINSTFLISSNGIRLDRQTSSNVSTNLFLLTSNTGAIKSEVINLNDIATFSSTAIKISSTQVTVATTAEIPGTNDLNKRLMVPVLQTDNINSDNGKYLLKQIPISNLGKFFNIQIDVDGAFLPISAGINSKLTGKLYMSSGQSINILSNATKGTQYNNSSGSPANVYSYLNFLSKTADGDGTAQKYGMVYSGSQANNEARTGMYAYNNYAPSNTHSTMYAYLAVAIPKSATPTRRTYTNCKVYGAVWNDYAEYRAGSVTAGGFCVTETASGQMIKSTERLQPGCKVTSDTFGFAIGESDRAQSPVAVSGRVLVYPYRSREEYTLGAALCSAPNGTVDIMTREEIREYPERIIGTVSEIPEYEIWHGGEGTGDQDVPIDGRIWIYVK